MMMIMNEHLLHHCNKEGLIVKIQKYAECKVIIIQQKVHKLQA